VLPEMSAKVAFLSKEVADSERKALPAINPSAIAKRDGKDVVFVVKDGRVAQVAIETGAALGDLVEVRRGPQAGDKVVLKPADKLRDAMPVKPATK
jgi:HlyD family secretion protein